MAMVLPVLTRSERSRRCPRRGGACCCARCPRRGMTRQPRHDARSDYVRSGLARLAVRLVLPAVRAVLAELDPVGVVTAVLARDVVAVLALLTSQRDLRPDVCRSHECLSSDMS